VLLALPTDESAAVERILSRLKELPVAVKLCPGPAVLRVPTANMSRIGGIPLLDVYDQPVTGWNRVLKALEDRIGGVVLAIVMLPLMLLIALGVKLTSPGPVLFRQKRYGFNNNEITVLKFRTMFHGADEDRAVPQATRRDPRITPFGRFLRRTSLDELPQLWNVIKGEMSLVGPRPHAVPHNEYYAEVIGNYLARHKMKPGITGWAQIHGFRGETTSPDLMKKRVEYDLYYIENWSILLDLKILLLTPFVGLVHRNAY
jgi:putative colanic acid biosynthesis UDP-glucose lipid carrier transferase